MKTLTSVWGCRGGVTPGRGCFLERWRSASVVLTRVPLTLTTPLDTYCRENTQNGRQMGYFCWKQAYVTVLRLIYACRKIWLDWSTLLHWSLTFIRDAAHRHVFHTAHLFPSFAFSYISGPALVRLTAA